MRESIPQPSANARDAQSAQRWDKNGPKHVNSEATLRRPRLAGHKLHKEFKTEIRSSGLLETSAWRDDTAMIQTEISSLWSERSRLVSGGSSLTDARMRTAAHFWRRRSSSSSRAAVKHPPGHADICPSLFKRMCGFIIPQNCCMLRSSVRSAPICTSTYQQSAWALV